MAKRRRKLAVAAENTEYLAAVAAQLQQRVVQSERSRALERNARNIKHAMRALRIPAAMDVWARHAESIKSGVADAEQVCGELDAMALDSFEARFRYHELGPRLCRSLRELLVPETGLLFAPECA